MEGRGVGVKHSPYYAKCAPRPAVGITWELVRRRLSGQAPDPVNQNLHLKKLPQGIHMHIKVEEALH